MSDAFSRRSFVATAVTAAVAAPSRKYRVAIIGHTGHGNYGHGIDTVWRTFEQIEIAAVADPDEKGRAAAVHRTGAKRGYADYREMLRREKPDLVGVGPRWLDQRKDMLIAAAQAGAHIYTEKPFALTLEEADAMVAAIRKNQVKVQVAHQMRVSPYTLRAKAMVDSGEIGAIQEIRVRGKEDRRAGGEDLMVLGTHLFDMLRYFLGDPKWVTAHVTKNGEELSPAHTAKPTEPIGPVAGNQITATFAFEGGVHGHFASRAADQTHELRFGTWLYGTKGVLFLPNAIYPGGGLHVLRSPAWLPDDKARWERVDAPPDAAAQAIAARAGKDVANALMVADLLRAVEHKARPCCDEEDGRWTLEMAHSIYHAQQSGGRVTFPLKSRKHPLEQ